MVPDETALYYLFSTIAQTLAAVVAILAAFVVMRLSDLARRLERELPALARFCQYPEAFHASLASGDFRNAIAQVNQESIDGGNEELILSVCDGVETERSFLFFALSRTFGVAATVIVLSTVLLALGSAIAEHVAVAWIAAAVGVGGLIVSLLMVGGLIAQLGSPKKRRRRAGKKDTKAEMNAHNPSPAPDG